MTSPRPKAAPEHPLSDFQFGDLVWAKSGAKNDPFWPAQVVDLTGAPEAVRNQAVSSRLCVMFLGPPVSKKRDRDFGWIPEGSVFPFLDYLVK